MILLNCTSKDTTMQWKLYDTFLYTIKFYVIQITFCSDNGVARGTKVMLDVLYVWHLHISFS